MRLPKLTGDPWIWTYRTDAQRKLRGWWDTQGWIGGIWRLYSSSDIDPRNCVAINARNFLTTLRCQRGTRTKPRLSYNWFELIMIQNMFIINLVQVACGWLRLPERSSGMLCRLRGVHAWRQDRGGSGPSGLAAPTDASSPRIRVLSLKMKHRIYIALTLTCAALESLQLLLLRSSPWKNSS
jgi:hypothetical protein